MDEIQSFQSKSQSLRDKMKKRRQAIESLVASAISGAKATEDSCLGRPEAVKDDQPPAKVSCTADKRTDTSKCETVNGAHSTDHFRGHERTRMGAVGGEKGKSGKAKEVDELSALLSMQSAKEREERSQQEEILSLLSKPTAKELRLMDTFKSQDGGGVKEFCSYSTKAECMKVHRAREPCAKLHFVKILQAHTDESLGDCSFLNTCFHMDSCKYIHYEVDKVDISRKVKKTSVGSGQGSAGGSNRAGGMLESTKLVPPQWIQCDMRNLKFEVLGKFSVIMADPPWDIHMELPYGTMSDDEMRQLPVPDLQDEGLIFLWVTGRAMELGRDCLKFWGYERVDEIIWVKTNQLQRIIRTGRTGHWLNHGKEHCLVGAKGNLPINRGLDCDVIVAEVRATSHKPDEIYGIIERLSPGTRKIELFGRPHNVQPNWVTLGNQLDGVVIHDTEMLARWYKVYPDGYNITENFVLHPKQE